MKIFRIDDIRDILKKAKTEAFFLDMLPQEKVSIEIFEQVETACWSFIPPHRIVIGGETYNSVKTENYIKSLLFHELSHALWTEKNNQEINKQLILAQVPFKLFNLFEDARIEHLFRLKTGKKFNWVSDISNKVLIYPEDFFSVLVNNEGKYPAEIIQEYKIKLAYIRDDIPYFYITNYSFYKDDYISKLFDYLGYDYYIGGFKGYPNTSAVKNCILEQSSVKRASRYYHGEAYIYRKNSNEKIILKSFVSEKITNDTIPELVLTKNNTELSERVREYYHKACQCKDTFEIIHLCSEWLKEFPHTEQMNNQQYGVGEDAISSNNMNRIQGKCIESDDGKKNRTSYLSSSNRNEFSNLFNDPVAFNENRLNKLTQLFKGIIKRGIVKYNSIIPNKRLNIRNYSLGSDKIFQKREYENGKSENISIILDCSGSMSSSHIYAGKELLIIINRLARAGLIRGNIILTETDQQIALPMPADETLLKSISTYGGEGFKTCIKKYQQLLKTSDKVFVFTDGEIGDEPDEDYNRKLGLKLWGLYVGNTDQTKQLKKYFNEAISRTSLDDVINEILKKVI